jgi:hypothetical protein
MHAWKYPAHEQLAACLARDMGFAQVSVSHEVSPLVKLVGRGDTTVVDAYLTPILRRYVDEVAADLGLSAEVRSRGELPIAGTAKRRSRSGRGITRPAAEALSPGSGREAETGIHSHDPGKSADADVHGSGLALTHIREDPSERRRPQVAARHV